MTLQDILKQVKELNFEPGTYIVFGSGPLAALGIRESSDVDMLVTPELRQKLKGAGWVEVDKGVNDKPVTRGDVEIHDSWNFSTYIPTLQELLSRATIIEDIPFASLEDVRAWKEASGRPKDVTDLKLIDAYLASR